jgi:hypothetical protein
MKQALEQRQTEVLTNRLTKKALLKIPLDT